MCGVSPEPLLTQNCIHCRELVAMQGLGTSCCLCDAGTGHMLLTHQTCWGVPVHQLGWEQKGEVAKGTSTDSFSSCLHGAEETHPGLLHSLRSAGTWPGTRSAKA